MASGRYHAQERPGGFTRVYDPASSNEETVIADRDRSGRALVILAVAATVLILPLLALVLSLTTGMATTPARCAVLGVALPGNPLQARCYGLAAARAIEAGGPAAVTELEHAAGTDRVFHGLCHNLMHEEGRQIGTKLGSQAAVTTTMRLVPDSQTGTCGAGMTHGIFEGYVERHGLSRADSSAFTIMCGKLSDRMRRYDCTHGLGHAATRRNDLDVEPSLRFCSAMPEPGAGDCASAVLMTHAEGPTLRGGPLAESRDGEELSAYCTRQPQGEARILCHRWIALTPSFSPALGRSDVVRACSLAERDSPEQLACFVGLGRQLPGADRTACVGLGAATAAASCSYGLLVGWVINRVDVRAAEAAGHCAWRPRGAQQNACYLALGRTWPALYEGRGADNGGAVCRVLDDAASRGWCLRGARLAWQPLDYSRAEHTALRAVVDEA